MSGQKDKEIDYSEFYHDHPNSGQEAEELLAAARIALLVKYPFFGKVALNLRIIESDNMIMPTTAVDQRGNFFFCRKWVNHFDMKDAMWSVAHETMHLVQRFFARKPDGANHFLWNLAADYVLETSLIDSGLPQSKHSLLKTTPEIQELVHKLGTIHAVYKHLLKNAEKEVDCPACKEIFKKLREQGEKQQSNIQKENKELNGNQEDKEEEGKSNAGGEEENGCGCGGENCGNCDGEKSEKGELKHTCNSGIPPCCSGVLSESDNLDPVEKQKWIEKIIAAKIHAESKGKMPAGLGEYIDQLTQSKVRWQDHLKASATRLFGRHRYSYKRINRRGHAIGLRLPGHTPDSKTAVGAIDTSASMSVEEVRQCVTEFSAIMKACGCEKLWLILHDSRVYFSGWVKEADLTKLKMARGGTSHIEVFNCLNRCHSNKDFNLPIEEEVSLAILFTDLGTDFPDGVPDFEVIWGVPDKGCPGMQTPVPFGKKVEVILD